MKVFFESQFYPDIHLSRFVSNSKVNLDFAAHNFSKAICLGLEQNDIDYSVLNVPNLGSYPSLYKRPYVPSAIVDKGKSLPYLNVTYIKRLFIKRRLFKEFKEQLKNTSEDAPIIILLYNFRCLSFLTKLKKLYPSIKVCLIITDLPQYMVQPNSKLLELGGRFVCNKDNLLDLDFSGVDGFVFLASKMSEIIPVGARPWMLMEGVYEKGATICDVEKSPYKTIMYAGNLNKRYGIVQLLDAFQKIEDSSYRLWLRGSGDGDDEIKARMANDNRIQLLPPLDRKDLLGALQKATLLVNPVLPSESFTSYFFPSKTLEFMASGTPVLMYHLKCMPSDYDDYIYYVEDESTDSLRDRITEICSKPQSELDDLGRRASSFILNNKNPKSQIAKVVEFILSL